MNINNLGILNSIKIPQIKNINTAKNLYGNLYYEESSESYFFKDSNNKFVKLGLVPLTPLSSTELSGSFSQCDYDNVRNTVFNEFNVSYNISLNLPINGSLFINRIEEPRGKNCIDFQKSTNERGTFGDNGVILAGRGHTIDKNSKYGSILNSIENRIEGCQFGQIFNGIRNRIFGITTDNSGNPIDANGGFYRPLTISYEFSELYDLNQHNLIVNGNENNIITNIDISRDLSGSIRELFSTKYATILNGNENTIQIGTQFINIVNASRVVMGLDEQPETITDYFSYVSNVFLADNIIVNSLFTNILQDMHETENRYETVFSNIYLTKGSIELTRDSENGVIQYGNFYFLDEFGSGAKGFSNSYYYYDRTMLNTIRTSYNTFFSKDNVITNSSYNVVFTGNRILQDEEIQFRGCNLLFRNGNVLDESQFNTSFLSDGECVMQNSLYGNNYLSTNLCRMTNTFESQLGCVNRCELIGCNNCTILNGTGQTMERSLHTDILNGDENRVEGGSTYCTIMNGQNNRIENGRNCAIFTGNNCTILNREHSVILTGQDTTMDRDNEVYCEYLDVYGNIIYGSVQKTTTSSSVIEANQYQLITSGNSIQLPTEKYNGMEIVIQAIVGITGVASITTADTSLIQPANGAPDSIIVLNPREYNYVKCIYFEEDDIWFLLSTNK